MARPADPTLAGVSMSRYYHACCFFHGRDEVYEVLIPFIAEGLARGEKGLHVTAPEWRADHVSRLRRAGVAAEAQEGDDAGPLEVRTWDDAHLRGGRFDPDAMLELLEEVIRRNRREGYTCTRMVGDMSWVAERPPGVDRVMEYEARVNTVLARHGQPAVCMYGLDRITAGTMLDVLRTHPLVLIGGTLTENPFFLPPAEFLGRTEVAGGDATTRGGPR